MILLDDLAAADGDTLALGSAELLAWRHLCAEAQRFTVDRDVCEAANRLQYSECRTLVQGLPMARLPYPVMWLETTIADRRRVTTTCLPPARRIGVMLIAARGGKEEGIRGNMLLAWSGEPGLCLCPVATTFDLAEPFEKTQAELDVLAGNLRREIDRQGVSGRDRERLMKDFPATVDLQSHFGAAPSPLHEKLLLRLGDGDRRKMQEIASHAASDWQGEPVFWLAIVMLINCRNRAVELAPVDLSRLNRARARKGRPAILEHRTVKLSLSRIGVRRAGDALMSAEAKRQHLVSGHFKLRRTGLYWWRAHIRGDAALGTVWHSYEVTR